MSHYKLSTYVSFLLNPIMRPMPQTTHIKTSICSFLVTRVNEWKLFVSNYIDKQIWCTIWDGKGSTKLFFFVCVFVCRFTILENGKYWSSYLRVLFSMFIMYILRGSLLSWIIKLEQEFLTRRRHPNTSTSHTTTQSPKMFFISILIEIGEMEKGSDGLISH